jgi:HAD superfamily hydrolase (TIGR01549 family)
MDNPDFVKFPPGIKLVTIDLDDTLWPCMPVIKRAELAMMDWLCIHAPDLASHHTVESLRAHRRLVARENPHIAYNLTLTRKISLQQLLSRYDYDNNLAEAAVTVFRQERNKVEPFADVIPALVQLGTYFDLIAVTNGNVEISRTPLAGYFRHALTAETVGAAKPDPKLFTEAMRLAGVTAAETMHIGDDPETDIEAARQAGLHCIWISRYEQEWPLHITPPEIKIRQLSELMRVMSDQ